MSERLATVADYVESIRSLLQDQTVPYRYPDLDILIGFNMMLLDARRVRADLFVKRWGAEVPHYDVIDGEHVPIEPQFRLGFAYGAAAYCLSFDTEDVNDARANSFMQFFHSILLGQAPTPLAGGTPGAKQQ